MIVHIGTATDLTLREPHDFKSFKIEIARPRAEFEHFRSQFVGKVRLENPEHGWVSIEALRRWEGPASDPAYQDGLAAMIKVADKYGWLDAGKTAIRAHIEWMGAAGGLRAKPG